MYSKVLAQIEGSTSLPECEILFNNNAIISAINDCKKNFGKNINIKLKWNLSKKGSWRFLLYSCIDLNLDNKNNYHFSQNFINNENLSKYQQDLRKSLMEVKKSGNDRDFLSSIRLKFPKTYFENQILLDGYLQYKDGNFFINLEENNDEKNKLCYQLIGCVNHTDKNLLDHENPFIKGSLDLAIKAKLNEELISQFLNDITLSLDQLSVQGVEEWLNVKFKDYFKVDFDFIHDHFYIEMLKWLRDQSTSKTHESVAQSIDKAQAKLYLAYLAGISKYYLDAKLNRYYLSSQTSENSIDDLFPLGKKLLILRGKYVTNGITRIINSLKKYKDGEFIVVKLDVFTCSNYKIYINAINITNLKLIILDRADKLFVEKKYLLEEFVNLLRDSNKKLVLLTTLDNNIPLDNIADISYIEECGRLEVEQIRCKLEKLSPNNIIISLNGKKVNLYDALYHSRSGLYEVMGNSLYLEKIIQSGKNDEKSNEVEDGIFIEPAIKRIVPLYSLFDILESISAERVQALIKVNSANIFLQELDKKLKTDSYSNKYCIFKYNELNDILEKYSLATSTAQESSNSIEDEEEGIILPEAISYIKEFLHTNQGKYIVFNATTSMKSMLLKILSVFRKLEKNTKILFVIQAEDKFDDLFISDVIELSPQENQPFACRINQVNLNKIPNSIYEIKENVDKNFTNELLKKPSSSCKRLIIGKPGLGKSTLVSCLYHNWLKERRFDDTTYSWVFLIQLGDLDKIIKLPMFKNEENPLLHFLKLKCIEELSQWQVDILRYDLMHNNILLILDGLDELLPAQQYEFDKLLRAFYKYSHIILTTRPGMSVSSIIDHKLKLDYFDSSAIKSCLENNFVKLGITKSSNFDLIWQNLEKQEELITLLKIPLHCYIFAQIWQSNPNLMELNKYKLYQLLVTTYLKNHLIRNEGMKESLLNEDRIYRRCVQELKRMEKVASQQIGFNLYQKPLEPNRLIDTDVTKIALATYIKESNQIQYRYLHQTLQEYFAASYIGRNLCKASTRDNFTKFIQVNRYDSRFNVVWYFLSKLLMDENNNIKGTSEGSLYFYQAVIKQPRDLIGYRHTGLMHNIFNKNALFRKVQSTLALNVSGKSAADIQKFSLPMPEKHNPAEDVRFLCETGFNQNYRYQHEQASNRLKKMGDLKQIKDCLRNLLEFLNKPLKTTHLLNQAGIILDVIAVWSNNINLNGTDESFIFKVLYELFDKCASQKLEDDLYNALASLKLSKSKSDELRQKIINKSNNINLIKYGLCCLEKSIEKESVLSFLRELNSLLVGNISTPRLYILDKLLEYELPNIVEEKQYLFQIIESININNIKLIQDMLKILIKNIKYISEDAASTLINNILTIFNQIDLNKQEKILIISLLRSLFTRYKCLINTENIKNLFITMFKDQSIRSNLIEMFAHYNFSSEILPQLLEIESAPDMTCQALLKLPESYFSTHIVQFIFKHINNHSFFNWLLILIKEKNLLVDIKSSEKAPEIRERAKIIFSDHPSSCQAAFDSISYIYGLEEALDDYIFTVPRMHTSLKPNHEIVSRLTSLHIERTWRCLCGAYQSDFSLKLDENWHWEILLTYIEQYHLALTIQDFILTLYIPQNPILLSISTDLRILDIVKLKMMLDIELSCERFRNDKKLNVYDFSDIQEMLKSKPLISGNPNSFFNSDSKPTSENNDGSAHEASPVPTKS